MSFSTLRNSPFVRFAGHLSFGVVVLAALAWAAAAVSFHLEPVFLYAAWGALGVIGVLSIVGRRRSRGTGWLVLLAGAALTMIWYQSIDPQEQRDWAMDVARGAKASVQGDIVQIGDIRNFTWTGTDTAEQDWTTQSYDLSNLATVDMITSVWDSPDIAHLAVSFGFTDGEHIAFSVETRRESDESFSAFGGFFRQFELILLAAKEEDIVKLRTHHRNEDVRLYPIALNETQRRDLFLSYVELAQRLEAAPEFYNTLTANCTTIVYDQAKSINLDVRPDWRIVLSGHLPAYIDKIGGFAEELTIEERVEKAAITEKARAYQGTDFSAGIRG